MGSLKKFRRRVRARLAALEGQPAAFVETSVPTPERMSAPPATQSVPGNLSLGVSVGAGVLFLVAIALLITRKRKR